MTLVPIPLSILQDLSSLEVFMFRSGVKSRLGTLGSSKVMDKLKKFLHTPLVSTTHD